MTARVYRFITANSNNLLKVGMSPCKLVGASIINTVGTAFYVKFWWFDAADAAAATPTVGTTPPDFVLMVPASGSITPAWPDGIAQSPSPLWVACVTGAADTDNTAVASGQGNINLLIE